MTITPKEAEELRGEDTVYVYVLLRKMFDESRIPGSISVQFDQLNELLPRVTNVNQKIVLYCWDVACQASAKAVDIVRKLGYDEVFDLEVGIEGYKKEFKIA